MKILILSVGRRGYLVDYFSSVSGTEVFAADSSPLAPGLYKTKNRFLLPSFSDSNYLKSLISVCRRKKITALISCNDGELEILSKHKDKFKKNGITAIVSKHKTIKSCFDKYKTYLKLKDQDVNLPKSFRDKSKCVEALSKKIIKFPLIAKPRKGSASIGIKKIENMRGLKKFEKGDDYFYQEFIEGDEYGVDLLCNKRGKPVSVFCKKKILMRAGETDKAVSVADIDLVKDVVEIAKHFNFFGPIDLDFLKKDGKYFLLEVNPRFGGGYPMAHGVGADFPNRIFRILDGKKLRFKQSEAKRKTYLMKAYDIVIKNEDELIS